MDVKFNLFKKIFNLNANYVKRTTKKIGSGVRVHLGPGEIDLLGWINIDMRDLPHIHLVGGRDEFKKFSNSSLSEVYACHILEHISIDDVKPLVQLLSSKIEKGGVIRLSVPDFDALIKIYNENGKNCKFIERPLLGGQNYAFNVHKSIYNKKNLSNILTECGFSSVEVWDSYEDFGIDIGDWSIQELETPLGRRFISLNLKAVKQ